MNRPYAVAMCRKIEQVLLSNGEVVPFTEWLDDEIETAHQVGPEIPSNARFVGFERRGKPWYTDLTFVEMVSLH